MEHFEVRYLIYRVSIFDIYLEHHHTLIFSANKAVRIIHHLKAVNEVSVQIDLALEINEIISNLEKTDVSISLTEYDMSFIYSA